MLINTEMQNCSRVYITINFKKCVDLIITDMAVMEVTQGGLILQELMSPYTVEDIKTYRSGF